MYAQAYFSLFICNINGQENPKWDVAKPGEGFNYKTHKFSTQKELDEPDVSPDETITFGYVRRY
jgi:hypothetical protein